MASQTRCTAPIAAVLFDKDGTLFDFHATWSAWSREILLDLTNGDADWAGRLGEVLGYDLAGGRFAPDSPIVAETGGEIARRILPHLEGWTAAGIEARMARAAQAAPQVEAVPLVPLLEALRARGLRLGVATNDADRAARAQLSRAGVLHHFDFIAGYDSGYGGKPAPGQLAAFAREASIAPENILMIGDSLHDLEAARAAGMIGLGVLTGPADHATLAACAYDILPDIGHLPSWLDARQPR